EDFKPLTRRSLTTFAVDKVLRHVLQREWPRETDLRIVTIESEGGTMSLFGMFRDCWIALRMVRERQLD
ncbi:MAG TPA: hypothetical protein VK893_01910, partial [Pyrinomonadaceae bacterium]|nr:hypothetical protein [Pyrinomonadaceae bacterium]